MQILRNSGWQDSYVYEEGGVTREILESTLAALPPSDEDIGYFVNTISKPENADKNLVAITDTKVVGAVLYEMLPNGTGDIGVFVARDFRGNGIGSKLLERLLDSTTEPLQVVIFARNRSRSLYKKFGFIEEGIEDVHYFDEKTYLPIQTLSMNR